LKVVVVARRTGTSLKRDCRFVKSIFTSLGGLEPETSVAGFLPAALLQSRLCLGSFVLVLGGRRIRMQFIGRQNGERRPELKASS